MCRVSLSYFSLPVLLVAGAMFYAGISRLLLCRRQVHPHLNFMFALTCFAMSLYDLFSAGLYSAMSPAEGAIWQQAQLVTLSFSSVFLFWFVADFTGTIPRRVLYPFCVFFVAVGVLGAFRQDWLLQMGEPAIKTVMLPANLCVKYFEVLPGPLAKLQSVVGMGALLYALWAGVKYCLIERQKKACRLMQALIIFMMGVVNDMLVSSGVYASVYLMEYCFGAIVLMMAASMSRELAETDQTRASLQQMEKRFQAVFKSVSVGIALTQPSGVLVQANTAMTAMLGRTRDEVTGRSIFDFFMPEDAEGMRASMEDLVEGDIGAYRNELRYVHPDGSCYWGDISAGMIRTPEGVAEATVWIVIGITERRRAVETLQSVNEQLEERIRERTVELSDANRQIAETLRQLKQDEGAAQIIQYSLLPVNDKEFKGVSFTHYILSSTSMSGDFLDYFEIDAEHIGFYMADVSGHGVSSAFVTVLLKSSVSRALERYGEQGDETVLHPARLLAHLNAEIRRLDLGKHVTFFYGVIDTVKGSLTFASGGHYPFPIFYHDDHRELLEAKGAPLGLFDFSKYSDKVVALPDEFALAILSDGVLEVLPQQHLRDKQAYLAMLVDHTAVTMAGIVAKLGLEKMREVPDDITALLIRKKSEA
jgi:PAS domain S-box-containing protein